MLNRLLASAGCSVASLGPNRSVVHTTVDAIACSLHVGDEQEALRLAADLWTRLTSKAAVDVGAEIKADPGSSGDRRWDALIGGVVERAAHEANAPVPGWTAASTRFLDERWFLTPYRSLHAIVLAETPAELAHRGVFVHESSLRSV